MNKQNNPSSQHDLSFYWKVAQQWDSKPEPAVTAAL